MLPNNFDFAQIARRTERFFTLKNRDLLGEDIDYAMVSWLKEDLDLTTITIREKRVPVCGKLRASISN